MIRRLAVSAGGRVDRLHKDRRPLWALADQAVVSACNFVTVLLLARHMEIRAFGAFMLTYTALLLTTALSHALIGQPHNILGPKQDRVAYRELTSALLCVQLVAGLVLASLVFAIAMLAYAFDPVLVADMLVGLSFVLLPWLAQDFFRRVLYSTSDARAAFVNDSTCYGLQLGIVVGWLAVMIQPVPPALGFAAFGLSSLAAAILGGWQTRDLLQRTSRTRIWLRWQEAWACGRWLGSHNILQWFGAYGHSWLVSAIVGVEDFGRYRAVIHLVNVVNPLHQAASAYLLPRGAKVFHEAGWDGFTRWMRDKYTILVIPLLMIVALLMLSSQQLITLAYGERFLDPNLYWIVVLGAIHRVITFTKLPLDVAFKVSLLIRRLFVCNIISLCIISALGIALIHVFGIYGVPVTLTATASALFVYQWHQVRRAKQ